LVLKTILNWESIFWLRIYKYSKPILLNFYHRAEANLICRHLIYQLFIYFKKFGLCLNQRKHQHVISLRIFQSNHRSFKFDLIIQKLLYLSSLQGNIRTMFSQNWKNCKILEWSAQKLKLFFKIGRENHVGGQNFQDIFEEFLNYIAFFDMHSGIMVRIKIPSKFIELIRLNYMNCRWIQSLALTCLKLIHQDRFWGFLNQIL